MNRRNLLFSLNIGLIICVFVAMFALPVFSVKAQAQYQSTMQTADNLQVEKDKLIIEMDKVKAGIINLMGEMVNMIAEKLEELTLEFNKFFKLVPETEEELENATSTATTTSATTTDATTSAPASTPKPEPTPEPTPPPVVCLPLPSGSQTYSVSSSNIPKIFQVTADRLDISFNSTQVVIADITDTNNNPITSVTGVAGTDTKTTSFTLSLASGTETNGTWQGSWTLKDSICMNFTVRITATSISGTSAVTITFR